MYKISQDCTGCGECAEECPVSAIHPQGDIFVIDAEACTSCGICEEICPVEAIFEE